MATSEPVVQNRQIDPLPVAATFWLRALRKDPPQRRWPATSSGPRDLMPKHPRHALVRNDETKPILHPEAG